MGAYCVVVLIKMGDYMHGVPVFYGCLLCGCCNQNGELYAWGAYFCMGAYCVVVVIKMGDYMHGVPISMGA